MARTPELIIFDMYGTIVCNDPHVFAPRNGFREFLKRYVAVPAVLATDDDQADLVKDNLAMIGANDRILRVYCADTLVSDQKDLLRIVAEYSRYSGRPHIGPSQAVFISDGIKDMETALAARIPFIHVPKFERPDEKFSFADVLLENLPPYTDLRKINP